MTSYYFGVRARMQFLLYQNTTTLQAGELSKETSQKKKKKLEDASLLFLDVMVDGATGFVRPIWIRFCWARKTFNMLILESFFMEMLSLSLGFSLYKWVHVEIRIRFRSHTCMHRFCTFASTWCHATISRRQSNFRQTTEWHIHIPTYNIHRLNVTHFVTYSIYRHFTVQNSHSKAKPFIYRCYLAINFRARKYCVWNEFS